MNVFGKNLHYLREQYKNGQNKLSQEELAGKVASTKSTISKYERGIIEPTLDVAKRIADFFNVTVELMVDPNYIANNNLRIAEPITEYTTNCGRYDEAIKLAEANNISPDKLLELVNFSIRMRDERE